MIQICLLLDTESEAENYDIVSIIKLYGLHILRPQGENYSLS